MGTKQRKARGDSETGIRKLAQLVSEEIARLMAERLAAMSDESIRAILRNCSRVARLESLPRRPKPLHVRVRRERLGPATGTVNGPTSSVPARRSSYGRGEDTAASASRQVALTWIGGGHADRLRVCG